MKNMLRQLKYIGFTVLGFTGVMIIAWIAQFIDKSLGITFILLIGGAIVCGVAILYFIFHIIVPPKTIDEVITKLEKERLRNSYGNPYAPAVQYFPDRQNETERKSPGLFKYHRVVLFISFLLMLGLIAVATKQISVGARTMAISDAIGPWFWWPLLGVSLMSLGGGTVIYKDQYGNYWQSQGGTGSFSLIVGFMLSFIVVYISLIVNAYWFKRVNFPANLSWQAWTASAVAFIFLGAAFMFLFKSENWRSHILLYMVMLFIVVVCRM